MSYQDDGGSAKDMTIRDHFAALALQGYLSDPDVVPEDEETFEEFAQTISKAAYMFADAMLQERRKCVTTH